MSIDPNIFDCLLDPMEIFAFYLKIGVVLKNDRDFFSERVRGQALQNTLVLLEHTGMIQKYENEYKKTIDCPTKVLFYTEFITRIKNKFPEEVSTIINCNKHFDEIKCQFFIYVNDIPLKYMGLAMLLEQSGEFERTKNRVYLLYVDNYREAIKKKAVISIEELKKKLQQDAEHGELAEKFAWKYEVFRLRQLGINKEPLSISNIDVTAGYDMISYESEFSESFDRFIEVKSVSYGNFFWSKNEYETAKDKGDKYYLYLVDLKKTDKPGYAPEMIQNPAKCIMESDGWFVEAQSYHIKHI